MDKIKTSVNELIREFVLDKDASFLAPFALDIAIKGQIFAWSNKKIRQHLMSTYDIKVSESSLFKYRKKHQDHLRQIAYAYLCENPGNPADLFLKTP